VLGAVRPTLRLPATKTKIAIAHDPTRAYGSTSPPSESSYTKLRAVRNAMRKPADRGSVTCRRH
jgi:hypothetical protein